MDTETIQAAAPADGRAEGLAPGLNVAGFLQTELGLGEAARRILAGVREAGIPHATVTYRGPVASRRGYAVDEGVLLGAVYDTNLICVNPESLPEFADHVGPTFFRGRYSIGLWFWEASVFPDSMVRGFDFVDEVWVASDYAAAAIAPKTDKPVRKVPIPVESPGTAAVGRGAFGLPDGFLFLFTFNFFSVFERKNPIAVVDAFTRAFAPGEGPVLVVKSVNGDRFPEQLAALRSAGHGRADVIVADGYLSAAEQNSLTASCDCYVSLHRSEGFGLTMAEAMAHGKPVIATRYSGNLEFMTDRNSYLVPARTTVVPEGVPPYPAGAEWSEPDVERAAELMRRVVEDPQAVRERADRGREDILERYSPKQAGAFMSRRLESIRREHPPAERTARERPFEALLTRPPTALERAAVHLARPPEEPLEVSGGRSPTGFVRSALARALWPYVKEERDFDSAVVEALRQLEQDVHSLEARLELRSNRDPQGS